MALLFYHRSLDYNILQLSILLLRSQFPLPPPFVDRVIQQCFRRLPFFLICWFWDIYKTLYFTGFHCDHCGWLSNAEIRLRLSTFPNDRQSAPVCLITGCQHSIYTSVKNTNVWPLNKTRRSGRLIKISFFSQSSICSLQFGFRIGVISFGFAKSSKINWLLNSLPNFPSYLPISILFVKFSVIVLWRNSVTWRFFSLLVTGFLKRLQLLLWELFNLYVKYLWTFLDGMRNACDPYAF